jgi:hypothetical protein
MRARQIRLDPFDRLEDVPEVVGRNALETGHSAQTGHAIVNSQGIGLLPARAGRAILSAAQPAFSIRGGHHDPSSTDGGVSSGQ